MCNAEKYLYNIIMKELQVYSFASIDIESKMIRN